MKTIKYIKYLLIILFIVFASVIFAQDGPGDPGGTPESGDNDPLGGRAPLSGGTIALIALGAIYAGKKIYELKKNESEELK